MFERFTPAAREVVVRAQQEARTFGHPWLGTEHLLLGVLTQPDAPGVSGLTELGVTLHAGRAALHQVVGRLVPDVDALRTIGIDLDEVRRRAEASFGPGALDHPPRPGGRRRLPWRRARCEPEVTDHLRFMPRAKRALERARSDALTLGDTHVGVEHILLGLLDP